MKTLLFLKNRFVCISINIFVLIICTMVSCTNNTKPEATKEVIGKEADAGFENTKDTDEAFLMNVAAMNLQQIQLGQLAQLNGNIPEVKELGVILEKMHTDCLKQVQVFAGIKQLTLTANLTSKGQDEYNNLTYKSADGFNNAYIDLVVARHKGVIKNFNAAAIGATDIAIRNWAAAMLPILSNHLDKALVCRKANETR